MEYRKKHVKPKPHLATDLSETFTSSKKLMETIDFF